MKILAVTSCPTGIAHTYMAAEALEQAAQEKGYKIKTETRGSVGVENELTAEEIAAADAIVLAIDTAVPMERFEGKKLVTVGVADALQKSSELIDQALKAPAYSTGRNTDNKEADLKTKQSTERKGPYKHLMNGVSFMIPFVVAGGIAIALSFLIGGYIGFQEEGTLAAYLMGIGGTGGFGLMIPILAGYIAYSIADRPGLAVGMIGGSVATQINAGFLGAIIAGFMAGYVVEAMKKYIKLPKNLQGIMPVLIIPVFGSLIVGLSFFYIIGGPAAAINTAMNDFLTGMEGSSAAVLGLIIGLMMAFDMGGPLNKAAYAFGTGTLVAGTGSAVMAAVMAAGMVPPIGLALATFVFKNKFTAAERESGKSALVLGISFITEGAIPFAAADPVRVIPSIMAGAGVTGALSMIFNATLSVPHGGIFVFFAVENLGMYLVSILVGSLVSAALVGFLKKPVETVQSLKAAQ
ncbi:PTS system D-fructose-specific IIB component (F1P-forming), Frc family (TC 4.A.2.1.1)/PTS system D-fructose-specific IIC component (F1P-forming), Frc family (TC 4.A.2.1.1) [Dethiosulfatibacter aminovorans DSM 17477]|uniref:PTS system D-fructose-specific IIB component (F1P-forming), Frc family (TC 4.A.2.1.1)/PTS system D-fructose-specific IIC component (F1P-forming), Frc family (TC 4.A.2.1.1) n=1 Tax=Dethiosulfatibacter aminovorans DSM 17477 TaxID=1121476 RepID=A0A1M6L2N9_9FIRM|nr:fructose-specific PTS transporter subunit EIIC [Dethiosulfatibacter aminovorans]SHJ65498.1 PTS system D-fructose-specific IIB component (F1P-forming), Frc family (TC 4.A.2.1.1)/PTS system D-fructose-specific IIC component (F1P-forming), Frc family (TC 4.A.2.1.1) [Dethiosulfatibacter aminovorans DSM 17477]